MEPPNRYDASRSRAPRPTPPDRPRAPTPPTPEPVRRQPLEGPLAHHPRPAQRLQLLLPEAEGLDRLHHPGHAGQHPVAPPRWQAPGEDLEDRPPVRQPGGQRRLQHGELVVVGEECGAVRPVPGRNHHSCPPAKLSTYALRSSRVL